MEIKEKETDIRVNTNPIRWYTGFYSLTGSGKGSIKRGAFLQIVSTGQRNTPFEISSIVISKDGKTSDVLPPSDFTIKGSSLSIHGVGEVTLEKGETEGVVSKLTGTLYKDNVTGYNSLSPVPLGVFEGTYYNSSGEVALKIEILTKQNGNLPLLKIEFLENEKLVSIDSYNYDPTMYLLSFSKHLLMMGTTPHGGLACYVVAPGGNYSLTSIIKARH